MLIHEKGPFIRGSLLLISFLVLFAVLLTPIMRDENGNHLTGLQYADNVFNELSKGSSYFIPGVRENVKSVDGKMVQMTVTMKKAALAPLAVALLQKSGATEAVADGGKVSFKGRSGLILTSATDDADALYHNNADAVKPEVRRRTALKVAAAWWYLSPSDIKELPESSAVREAPGGGPCPAAVPWNRAITSIAWLRPRFRACLADERHAALLRCCISVDPLLLLHLLNSLRGIGYQPP